MRSVRPLVVSVLACTALLAGCGDPSGPLVNVVDNLFSEIADTWASSTNLVSVSPGVTYLASPPAARTCVYRGSSQRFECPSRVLSRLTFSTSYQLLDGGQASQAAFDSRTIDAIHTVTDVSGTSSAGATISTITARDDQVMSGLLSGTHVLNGTATVTMTNGSAAGGSTMVETTAGLILAARGSSNPYPRSGSVTTLVYAGLAVTAAALLATVTSTFNGTPKVTLLIETGGLTQTCTMDLNVPTSMVCN